MFSTGGSMMAGLALLAGLLCGTGAARADVYKVCNQSPDRIVVSIAYAMNDARGYISNGWWSLGPNGGCATVLNGPLPIRGVFVRGEGPHDTWEGETLFCVMPHGAMNNANDLDRQACLARGGAWKTFQVHVLNTANFTTNLRSNPKGHPGPAGFGDDSHACAADMPCFQSVSQTGDRLVFRFDGVTGWDFYNVRLANGRQFKNESGTFTLDSVLPNHTYALSVQGCHARVLASSRCSGWVQQTAVAR